MSGVVDIRERPRSHQTASVGMLLLLISWAMTFVALFLAFAFIRFKAMEWPPAGVTPLPREIPFLNTLVVVGSSLTLHRALVLARRGGGGVGGWLSVTGALGLGFLFLQGLSWWQAWDLGLKAGENAYHGSFYMMTIFHALHVVSALIALLYLTPRLRRGEFTIREHLPLRLVASFWHFVTFAWFGTFGAVYLL